MGSSVEAMLPLLENTGSRVLRGDNFLKPEGRNEQAVYRTQDRPCLAGAVGHCRAPSGPGSVRVRALGPRLLCARSDE